MKVSYAPQSKYSNVNIPHPNQNPKRKLKESLSQFHWNGETASRREEGSPICMHGPLWRRTGRFRVLPVLLLLHIASCCCTQYTAELRLLHTLGQQRCFDPGRTRAWVGGQGQDRARRGSEEPPWVYCARACSTTKCQSDVNRPRPILELSDKIFPRPTKGFFPFPGQFEIEAWCDFAMSCQSMSHICELLVFYTAWHETAWAPNSSGQFQSRAGPSLVLGWRQYSQADLLSLRSAKD